MIDPAIRDAALAAYVKAPNHFAGVEAVIAATVALAVPERMRAAEAAMQHAGQVWSDGRWTHPEGATTATVPVGALAWVNGGNTGLSSLAVFAQMTGTEPEDGYWSHPLDGRDLQRCIELLDAAPSWAARIGEMAQHSEAWAKLVSRWDDLAAACRREVAAGGALRITSSLVSELVRTDRSNAA